MVIVSLVVVASVALVGSSSVFAAGNCASCRPWWHLTSSVRPAVLSSGGEGTVVIQAANVGNDQTSGPITVSATLPAGLSVVTKGTTPQILFWPTLKKATGEGESELLAAEICQVNGATITCTTRSSVPGLSVDLEHVVPFETLELWVKVKDSGAAPGSEYHAEVSGGEAATVTRHQEVRIEGEAEVPFGVEEYNLVPEEIGGGIDSRAGSHPYQLTTTVALNQTSDPKAPPALARNFAFKLPPGQVGSATAVPKCSAAAFDAEPPGQNGANLCPENTAIGVAIITFDEPAHVQLKTIPVPLYNLETAYGEPARFGFVIVGNPVILDTSVRSGQGEDYGVTVSVSNTTEIVNFITSTVVFWGAPGDASHDESRGFGCIREGKFQNPEFPTLSCVPSTEASSPAFLTLPTNCEEPYATSVTGVSWPNKNSPGGAPFGLFSYSLEDATNALVPMTDCNQVPFSPSISAEASTEDAAGPSGLDFNINFHDEGLTSASGLAQSQVNKTVVTLPEGFTIDPSAGVGLVGCTPADFARETIDSIAGEGCPNESKLGTVEMESPLLAQKIHGSLYIAQPYENPFPEPQAGHPGGTLVALYIVAKNPETGILIKVAGKVVPNPITGQLTTIFENIPQLPFNHFNFHFREGAQAPLISPPTCGTYTTQAQLTPWSAPMTSATESSSFTITKGAGGGACPTGGIPPFKPGIVSGVINNNAGSFSPFYLHLTRTDGEQEISGFSTNLPSGLTGNLSGIPFCPEADIEAARHKTGTQEEANPSCPAASQIGHTLVGTGVGSVLAYVPGKIYLAGQFHGAPLSIVSVTSAVVGPFDLGTVVLRFGLDIDPTTARVDVTPTSSEPIPTIIDGIVTHVRDIRVYIDRSNFILNPTSCNPLSIASTLNSPAGASQTVTSPFQDSNCQALKFAPTFKVSTSGKTSRTQGASLHVNLTYPTGALAKDANIARVKVDLPRQLPSRLTTLQKACTEAQFESNPAGCPAESHVGQAKAITPLIPVPLEGPAIFVSHGGAKFPELIIVLQGYGLTIDLHGETFINKAGITSSTFPTIPDQPIGSFELTLPEGRYSALAANGNLCKSTLTMPTAFVAQNGAEIHKNTPIGVTGCKPSVNIVRHKVKGATVTITASVPSAGKLVASGPGLSHASKRIGKAGTLSFSLKLSGRGQALLRGHPGRKLAVAVKLRFTPTHGPKLSAGMTVNVG